MVYLPPPEGVGVERSSAASGRRQGSEGRDPRRRRGRPLHGHPAPAGGSALVHDLREVGRHRRHLARQQLSRRGLRRAVAPLLLLVRAEAGLDAEVLAAGRDPATTSSTAPTSTDLRRTSASAPRSRARASTRRAGVWRAADGAPARRSRRDVLVSGLGQLNRPHVPDLPGLATFRGHDVPLGALGPRLRSRAARRVAVIGNAASAIQFIPQIAPERPRTSTSSSARPNWMIPRHDRAYSEREKRLFAPCPCLARLYRWFIWCELESRFSAFRERRAGSAGGSSRPRRDVPAARRSRDPALRAALTPDYPVGCKRILISDDYYPALGAAERRARDEPDRARSTPDGVVTRRRTRARRRRDGLRAPASRPRRSSRRSRSRASAAASCTRRGATAPRRTSASPSPASRTSSCCTARTRTSATTRSSS